MNVEEPRATFLPAAREVLDYLQMRFGFGLWMVTRTAGEDWIVLAAEDQHYGVEAGDVFKWSDSFCSRMVRGKGPRIAHNSSEVPAYVEAPIGQQVDIGAYIGMPLRREDGGLFGTLCAIDPYPQPEEIERELPQIELFARLLEVILETDLKAQEEHRRAERAEAIAMTDPLTGLFNRRGWDQLLASEEQRCVKYSNPAAIFSIDLDDLKKTNDLEGHAAGDQLLKKSAEIILQNIRKTDVAARIGGDEFFILAVECHDSGVTEIENRLKAALEAEGISASMGYAQRKPHTNLAVVSECADKAMYKDKHERKKPA